MYVATQKINDPSTGRPLFQLSDRVPDNHPSLATWLSSGWVRQQAQPAGDTTFPESSGNVGGGVASSGTSARVSDPRLDTWREALANRAYARANLMVLGDSWVEGWGASAYGKGNVELLASVLPASLGVNDVSTFVPMWFNVAGYPYPVTLGTGAGKDSNSGWSLKGAALDLNQTATFTFAGTQVALDFESYGATTASVKIDGSNVATITANNGALSTWTSGVLAAGSHTVVVTCTANGGGPIYAKGFTVTSGSASKGIAVLNGGQGGKTSGQFNTSTAWVPKITQVQPHAVVICLGLNDYYQALGASALTTNVQGVISTIRSNCATDPSIVLLTWPHIDAAAPGITPYRAAVRAVAKADPTIGVVDLAGLVPNPALSNPVDVGGFFNATHDHPSDAYHALIAGRLAAVLAP